MPCDIGNALKCSVVQSTGPISSWKTEAVATDGLVPVRKGTRCGAYLDISGEIRRQY